jgi:multidrug efflux pump subunit AcrA (membrane-fusion protein)
VGRRSLRELVPPYEKEHNLMRRQRSFQRLVLLVALLAALAIGGDRSAVLSEDQHSAPASGLPSPATSVELNQCLVSLIDDVEVPALEAGQLKEIAVREGAGVKAGQLVAMVDDARATLQQQVVDRQHQQAKIEAENDVNVRYSKAQSEVSQAEHEEALEANRISAGAVAAAEVRRLLLTTKRSRLAIEQAGLEQQVAIATEKVRAAELQTAGHDVQRRRVLAPLEGTVVEVFKRPGEWVQAGERVLRLVRMDRLRVEGFVDARQFGDEEIVDRPVHVRVDRQRGQREVFAGRIVFVSPLIEANGNYRVWAEVDNRQANGRWLLRPGLDVHLTIDLKAAGKASDGPSP